MVTAVILIRDRGDQPFAFLILAQRRVAAAAIFALASGLMFRLAFFPLFAAGPTLAAFADVFGALSAGAPLARAAQRAFMAAANFARPSGLSPPFPFALAAGFAASATGAAAPPRALAQRAFCDAAIRARTSAERLTPRLPPRFAPRVRPAGAATGDADATGAELELKSRPSSARSDSSRSAISIARLRLAMDGMIGVDMK